MTALRNRLTAAEAQLVRAQAAGVDLGTGYESPRIWQPSDGPIRVEPRGNSRARCRRCGERLPEGTPAIVFGFDPLSTPGWGRLGAAYLHVHECQPKEEEA